MSRWKQSAEQPLIPAGATHRARRGHEDREVPGLIYSQDVWHMIDLATGEVAATIDSHPLETVREVLADWRSAGWVALGHGYVRRVS